MNASAGSAALTEAAPPGGACSASLLPCRLCSALRGLKDSELQAAAAGEAASAISDPERAGGLLYTGRALLPALQPAPAPSSFLLTLCF